MIYDSIRYIKLGAGKTKTDEFCIANNLAYIGFGTAEDALHKLALNGDWERFRSLTIDRDQEGSDRARKQRATSATNQVRAFFECDKSTLWITFYGGFLYYGCISRLNAPSINHELGGCTRTLSIGWNCEDANNNKLKIENLSGNLTKVRSFKGTSCTLDNDQTRYLLTRLSGKIPAYIKQIDMARQSMVEGVLCAIKELQPKDFELLVEIVFSHKWLRIGQAGGAEKFVDITFEDPLYPDQRIAVQVKSETSLDQIESYVSNPQFERYERMIFVFHTLNGSRVKANSDLLEEVEIIDGTRLANMVVDSGLVNWLREKTS